MVAGVGQEPRGCPIQSVKCQALAHRPLGQPAVYVSCLFACLDGKSGITNIVCSEGCEMAVSPNPEDHEPSTHTQKTA
jgi:hypothetical protein